MEPATWKAPTLNMGAPSILDLVGISLACLSPTPDLKEPKQVKRKKLNLPLFTGRFLMHAKVYLGKKEDNLRHRVQLGSGGTHF